MHERIPYVFLHFSIVFFFAIIFAPKTNDKSIIHCKKFCVFPLIVCFVSHGLLWRENKSSVEWYFSGEKWGGSIAGGMTLKLFNKFTFNKTADDFDVDGNCFGSFYFCYEFRLEYMVWFVYLVYRLFSLFLTVVRRAIPAPETPVLWNERERNVCVATIEEEIARCEQWYVLGAFSCLTKLWSFFCLAYVDTQAQSLSIDASSNGDPAAEEVFEADLTYQRPVRTARAKAAVSLVNTIISLESLHRRSFRVLFGNNKMSLIAYHIVSLAERARSEYKNASRWRSRC